MMVAPCQSLEVATVRPHNLDVVHILVGKTSYYHLLSKLQMIGVVDESLDRILAGCSNGKFDNK